MKCGSCSSTKAARLYVLESMCGHQATVRAHHWPHTENTCWLPGDSSALMARRIGYCCLMLVMHDSGVPRRTAEFGWLPGAVQSKPPGVGASPGSCSGVP